MRSVRAGQEDGVALIMVVMALALVTAIGMGMILLSNTEVNINANYRDEQIALFAAKAGLEEARDRMMSSNPSPITLPTVLPGGGGGSYLTYIIASGAAPWSATGPYQDNEFLQEMGLSSPPSGSSWYTSTATNSSYSGPSANPIPYKWVRVNLKIDRSAYTTGSPYYVDGNSSHANYQVCWDTATSHEVAVSSGGCTGTKQPVYEITSYAVTRAGTHRMLQSEVVMNPINITLPGALTVDGPLASGATTICGSGSTCNGSGAYLTGNNPSGCATGTNVPAIAAVDATSQANLAAAIAANKSNIVGTGGSPSVANASSALANLSTVSQIEALVAQFTSLAGTNVGADCSTLDLGTSASPRIAVVTNAGGSSCDLNSGATGYGILVVTGTLQYVNVNSYQGIVLMLGTAQFVSSSSKDTTLTGALFMAQDRNPTTGALLAGPGLGSPTFNFHHGNASASDPSIQYNQCVISQVENTSVINYKVLLQRELMF